MPALPRLAAVLCASALLASCTVSTDGSFERSRTLLDPSDRDPAPDVCGETTQGEALCLDAYDDGTPTLVNFWGSWCGPCATEVPELIAVGEAYGDDLDLVGVNIQDASVVNARSFERDQRVTYPSFYDDTSEIAAAFGGIAPEVMPTTILLDAEHRVAIRMFGSVTQRELQPLIDQLIDEAA